MNSGSVYWMTGRSGAGKTTLGGYLCSMALRSVLIDGDQVRRHVSSDLGYDRAGRGEHARRVAGIARLLADQGFNVVVTLISPFEEDRARAREIIGADRFVLVWVKARLETCEQRDPKGLYKKARAGGLANLIDFPYEEPAHADLVIDTDAVSIEEGCSLIRARIGAVSARSGI